jgi:hypothetical protein
MTIGVNEETLATAALADKHGKCPVCRLRAAENLTSVSSF